MLNAARFFKCIALASLSCGLLFSPEIVSADDVANGRLYYDEGTRLEFPDFDFRLNMLFQPRYSYSDIDSSDRASAGFGGSLEDRSDFSLRRARLILSGQALDESFSYKLEEDFASDEGGGDLRDAWIQWNGDPAKIRFGQFKQPFGREERISSTRLFFTDRSVVSEAFVPSRRLGAMTSGSIGSSTDWYAAINNGSSENEGENSPGQDNNVQGVVAFDFRSDNFGSRGIQGDFRSDRSFAFTAGLAATYGEGTVEAADFEEVALNADLGFRVAGAEVSGEFFYSDGDLSTNTSSENVENIGFVVDANYVFKEKFGVGARYALLDPDDSFVARTAIEEINEYSLVFNYFINGHDLKLQNGVVYQVADSNRGSSLDDFRYDLQLSGYF